MLIIVMVELLQELGWDKGKKPERMVDGWNTWFCEDVDRVRSLWTPRPGTGHLCVAHLFIRFLKYYSEVSESPVVAETGASLTD